MDENKYVDMLVAAGKDKKEAVKFIKALIARIKESIPGATEETIESTIFLKLDDILHGSSGDPFTGIVIGCDNLDDSNRYSKEQALEAFKKDSNQAIMKGLVKMGEDGQPIPLDARQFLDKKETKKNNNFGKPLPTQLRRQMVILVDGKIVRAFGKEDPELCVNYDFKATVTESGFYTIAKDSMKKTADQPTPVQLWDVLYSAAGSSEAVVALCDVVNAAKNAFIVTKGFVKMTQETSNGGAMMILKDGDCEEGVVCFSAGDDVREIINHEIVKGQEIIAVGRVAKNKDGRTNVVVLGVVPNPASEDITKGLSSLDDMTI